MTKKTKIELPCWEDYGIGFNAECDVDGYVCVDSDVSLYDTDEIAKFVMNTPPPPSGPHYFEMSLNGRLDFGYSGRPYVSKSEYKSFTENYPEYEKSFLEYNSSYAFRKRSLKALEQYIDYVRKVDGGLIVKG